MIPTLYLRPSSPGGVRALGLTRSRGRRSTCLLVAVVLVASLVVVLLNFGDRSESTAAWLRSYAAEGLVMPRFVAPAWLDGTSRQPLFIATAAFFALTCWNLVTQIIIFHPSLSSLVDEWSKQLRLGFTAHLLISTLSLFSYLEMAFGGVQLVTGKGEHLLVRNFVWALSNPTQWYVFACSFTSATQNHMISIIGATSLMHLFGILMLLVKRSDMMWFCFWASSAYFVVMFQIAFEMEHLRETRHVSRRILHVWLILWSMYPIASFAQYAGMISDWTAQVVVYSFLDVLTKCASFSAIITSRMLLTLETLSQMSKFVNTTYDVVLVVDDGFMLIEVVHTPPLLEPCWEALGNASTLLSLCVSDQHASLLSQTAARIDGEAVGVTPPKCMASLKFSQEVGEVSAEWLVARCTLGRRMIGMKILSVSGAGLSC
jgi:hypothetical protein